MRILISACLLGIGCRYDGQSKACEAALRLAERHTLVPVCPEQLGGLPTPRPPCERRQGRVICCDGSDRTDNYRRGAAQAAKLCEIMRCGCAVLKARSPMCGSGMIYDGTFSGALREGDGVLCELLRQRKIAVYREDELYLLQNEISNDGKLART